jgi:di/tricarboxylate transporter
MPPTTPAPAAPPPIVVPEDEMLEPGEHIVTVVRKHFIGIIGLYLGAIVGVTAILSLVFVLAPSIANDLTGPQFNWFVAIAVFGAAVLLLILFVATYVYRQSRIMLTDKSVVEVNQKSLFIRKVSRLSMANVEDVTAEQRGILATIFNYGTLTIQTAGTMENFIFTYCPRPNDFAHRVLEARQAYALSLEENQERR